MSEQYVWVTKRGHAYHATLGCEWLDHARTNARRLGRTTWPAKKIPISKVGVRYACHVCRPLEKI